MIWEEIHTPQNMELVGDYILAMTGLPDDQWDALYDWRESAVRSKNVEEYAKLLNAAKQWRKTQQ